MADYVREKLAEEFFGVRLLLSSSDQRVWGIDRSRHKVWPLESMSGLAAPDPSDGSSFLSKCLPPTTVVLPGLAVDRLNLIWPESHAVGTTGLWTAGRVFRIDEPMFAGKLFVDVCGIKKFETGPAYCKRVFDQAETPRQLTFVRDYLLGSILGYRPGPAYDHYFYLDGNLHLLVAGLICLDPAEELTMQADFFRSFFRFYADAYLIFMLFTRWQVEIEAGFKLLIQGTGLERLMTEGAGQLFDSDLPGDHLGTRQ
ncbi:MAG: hypothetical protein A2284_11655 [Deltaproteobacteria bacterium RIFOXYA12_FULL_61_11]|nr:MAG: hypothetical protein A2284_11655 [Deltaproteobacteria bacterium RIFOXYA12_FULL_61_11]